MPWSPLTDPATIRLLPLGGLGEIGLNMMAIESQGAILLVDCGLMFPDASMLGVDLVLPDVRILETRRDDICGLLLTHGHEDHIGAIPYLLDGLGYPTVYGTELTLGLLRGKLVEHSFKQKVELVTILPRLSFDLGPFQVEPFRVTHSVADGVGFAIRTSAGLIVHTGDFKLDATPIDGEMTDLARLAAYGEAGVFALLSDSTNVERPGHTLSERCVGEALRQRLPACRGTVLVASFSSNIHRIQQVLDAARQVGRKVLINGRSMAQSVAISRQLDCLHAPDDLFIDVRELRTLPRDKVLILSTGSQGEPRSSLARIATDDHKEIFLQSGDTVILSSRFIPGNEKTIAEMINHLFRRGADVWYEGANGMHVSGHASQEELTQMIALTRPRYFVPVHGDYRHLVRHAQLAESLRMAGLEAIVIDNGQPLLLNANGFRRETRVHTGRIYVDGKGVGDLGPGELRDRRHLASHGVVAVFLTLSDDGRIMAGPELLTRGFVGEEGGQDCLADATEIVRELVANHFESGALLPAELTIEIRKGLGRYFNRSMARRPVILPLLIMQP
ncbi:MAG: ribonuclease J [Deltaproteobacteria bacterium HGW-Deltaproteobacteria-4]|nr:MAG: ribonuclease J [Deltaproteobacteria bacterium HGW-Deltaproteobacteria-4]